MVHRSPRPAATDITARLRDAITRGRLMPNERLIEADLAGQYRVNRAHIRTALAMLDQEGLVVREKNRGARVRAISDAEALEIAGTRLVLEVMVARQAAERAGAADRKALREIESADARRRRRGRLFALLATEWHASPRDPAHRRQCYRLAHPRHAEVASRAAAVPRHPAAGPAAILARRAPRHRRCAVQGRRRRGGSRDAAPPESFTRLLTQAIAASQHGGF